MFGQTYDANTITTALVLDSNATENAGEFTVRGLEPDIAWSINSLDDVLYAGVTGDSGTATIPRTAKDGVTITRTASFNGTLNGESIPDRGVVYDTVHVAEFGTVNDLYVSIASTSSSYDAYLTAPDGTTHRVDRLASSYSGTRLFSLEEFAGTQMNGDWTLAFKSTSGTPTLQEWTLDFNTGTEQDITLAGSGNQYSIEVRQAYSGAYVLGLMDVNGIRDASNNLLDLSLAMTVNETHYAGGGGIQPDRYAPLHVYSIERHNPITTQSPTSSLEYLVTFNEPVTNVDSSDFAHVYSSRTPITTTQNTDLDVWFGESMIDVTNIRTFPERSITPSPSLPLVGDGEVTSTTYISTNGAVASVEVYADITNPFLNDVGIELIAPDGTSTELCSGGCDIDSNGNISDTYTPTNTPSLADFRGTDLRGTWTLQVSDGIDDSDDGTLNNWKLRIDYGTSAVTYTEHAPATSRMSISNIYTITNATLILNATAIDDRNVDEWEISLTSPRFKWHHHGDIGCRPIFAPKQRGNA